MTKIAYLVQGLSACGKSTYAKKQAKSEGGVCVSFDDFYYEVVQPEHPDTFTYDKKRNRDATRWFWMQLKKNAETGVSPIYVDQDNVWSEHTWRTAAFLHEQYGYEIRLAEPENPMWEEVKPLLEDKDGNMQELLAWIDKAIALSDKNLSRDKVILQIGRYEPYTVEQLMDMF
jgi:predicted kinase